MLRALVTRVARRSMSSSTSAELERLAELRRSELAREYARQLIAAAQGGQKPAHMQAPAARK